MNNDQYQFIITRKNNAVFYGYFQSDSPIELYCDPEREHSLVGNIYAARVERVTRDIGAAFLEFADGQKCYYALPKDASRPILLSAEHAKGNGPFAGDILLVQIAKDAVKSKLPVADGNISITGKYFVLTLTDTRLGISKKIEDAEERKRLLNIAKLYSEESFGLIVRTNAKGMQREELAQELAYLKEVYAELMRKASIAPGKTLLYKESPHFITYPKDLPKDSLKRIITDQEDIYQALLAHYRSVKDEEILSRITFYQDEYPLWKLYRMETHYTKALDKTVWLPSGGSIVIEPTEAMVVIDVNTAGVTKKKIKEEDLFYQINHEAAAEIGRQLRLRNLSGIIVIDFINMRYEKHRRQLLNDLREVCSKDRIRTHVAGITTLNLVEMTRQKVRKPLHEQCDKKLLFTAVSGYDYECIMLACEQS